MHLPPAVSYKVVRSRWHFFVLLMLCFVALVSTAGLWGSPGPVWRPALSALVVALCIAMSARALLQSAQGTLLWDGSHWLWTGFGDDPVKGLNVAIDLQRVLLVQAVSSNHSTAWLFLQAGSDAKRWAAVRRALYARRGSEARTGDSPDDLLDSHS